MKRRTRSIVRIIALAVVAIATVSALVFAVRLASFRRDVEKSNDEWRAERPSPIGEFGTTRTLTILPLLDWHASRPHLATEVGVSYLVKTDTATILFDLGNNTEDADPSPLERNMKVLGVAVGSVDTLFISHAHFDHVGGKRWTDGDLSGTTFGLGRSQPNLSGKRVLTPIPMRYPGIVPEVAKGAVRIAPGVATTGTIRRRLFAEWIDEQALAVNVEGQGIVLVVGCGHQTLKRLLERFDAVFAARLYGIVGGLHYPVPEGRIRIAGLDSQRLFGSGDGPLAPLTEVDVDRDLEMLKSRNVGLIAIGGHDSSDAVIEKAKERFGMAHRYLRVGEPIVVGITPSP